jgi:hypothetical protein
MRAAAQTWPVSGLLRGGRVAEKLDVFQFGSCRTNRPAVDARGLYRDHKLTVKAVVSGKNRVVQIFHNLIKAILGYAMPVRKIRSSRFRTLPYFPKSI